MSIEQEKVKRNGWSPFAAIHWPRGLAGLRRRAPHRKSGRELAQDRYKRERDGDLGLFELGDLFTASVIMAVVAMTVTAGMAILAAAYFQHPGLVEWIGGLLAQNCLSNGVCDFSTNLAAFAVANVILIELLLASSMMILRAADSDGADDTQERLAQLDSSLMTVMGEVGELRDQVEGWRHEREPIPPDGAA